MHAHVPTSAELASVFSRAPATGARPGLRAFLRSGYEKAPKHFCVSAREGRAPERRRRNKGWVVTETGIPTEGDSAACAAISVTTTTLQVSQRSPLAAVRRGPRWLGCKKPDRCKRTRSGKRMGEEAEQGPRNTRFAVVDNPGTARLLPPILRW